MRDLAADLADGKAYLQLLKRFFPDDIKMNQNPIDYIKDLCPEMSFMNAKDLANPRYNQAALTGLYRQLALKPPVEEKDALPWLNSILKHQTATKRIAQGIDDLFDGEILAAVTDVLKGVQQPLVQFFSAKEQKAEIPFVLGQLHEIGVPEYAQPQDFAEQNREVIL